MYRRVTDYNSERKMDNLVPKENPENEVGKNMLVRIESCQQLSPENCTKGAHFCGGLGSCCCYSNRHFLNGGQNKIKICVYDRYIFQ